MMQEVAGQMNGETLTALLEGSLPQDVMETVYRVHEAFTNREADMMQDTQFNTAMKVVNKRHGVLAEAMTKALKAADKAERNKLELLAQIKTVNQYGVEGGEYTLTEDDYTNIEERQKTSVTERVMKTLGRPVEPQAEIAAELEQPNVFGVVGQPVVASDPDLVQILQNNPSMKVSELITHLGKALRARPASAERSFAGQMIGKLKGLVDPAMEIRYITPDTSQDLAPDADITQARGYYDVRNGVETINIKSPDFVDSGITTELIIHEMLHSVLYAGVDQVQKGKLKNSDADAMVKELEVLRTKAQAYVDQAGNESLKAEYANALSDVHELIAWGMTNKGFQDTVLKQIKATSSNLNKLGDGFREFIRSIARFVFGKASEANTTGLGVLMVNVSGLMEQVATAHKDGANVTANMQDSTTGPESVNQYTTEQVYESLATDQPMDANTDTRLRRLLNQVVDRLHGPYGVFKADAQVNAVVNPQDVFIQAKATGQTPFATETLGYFDLTDQQAYVLEQVEVSVRASLASDTLAYKDLVKTYKEARSKLTEKAFYDGDWSQANQSDKDDARDKYRFVFDVRAVPGSSRSDHLSRFTALALVHPTLHSKLNTSVRQANEPASDKLGDRLKGWFDSATRNLGDSVNNTRDNQPANNRMAALVDRLVEVESKRKAALIRDKASPLEQFESASQEIGRKAKDKVADLADADAIRNSGSSLVRATGKLTKMAAQDRVDELLATLEDYRAWNFKQRQGFLASLMSEARGALPDTQQFHKLLRMTGSNERHRKQINENVKNDVRERYEITPTVKQSAALTKTLLRTDLSSLMDQYTVDELAELVRDPVKVAQEIQKAEQAVENLGQHGGHYLVQSKLLGYFMATGKARGPHMSRNAHNIASLFGTPQNGSVTGSQLDNATAAVDTLVSLYAVKYTKPETKAQVAEIFKRENLRGNESGVLHTLLLHKKMKSEAMEKSFDGDPALFTKGYTREIYNPHRDVRIANAEQGAELKAMGWSEGGLVHNDANDPQQEVKRVYTLQNGGLNAYVTGSMSLTDSRAKGSRLHGGESLLTEDGIHEANQKTNRSIEGANRTQVSELARQGRAFDPEKVNDNFLVPIYNPNGEVVNYRYMMTEANKDELLERDNRLDHVLGSMASHTYDKVATKEQNRIVVKALKDHHRENYARRPEAFIKVGPQSDDAQARETYHLLPADTKKAIKEIWGGNEMLVRADLLDMTFGYRKFSASTMFAKERLHRNIVEKITVDLLESGFFKHVLGEQKAGMKVRQFEDAWQEVVKEIKDVWVIKNLTTLLGNISSNVSILLWAGVSPKMIVETHKTAIDGLLQYQNDSDELMKLERDLELGIATNTRATEQRVLELRDGIDRNPVKGLIDEGLFQTIMEDIDVDNDLYSYKSKLVGKVDGVTSRLPSAVRKAGKTLYLAHDTPAYKLLFKTTQMSDFVARYSLYQHLTTKKKDPMSHDQAVQRSVDAFVNYDLPTHRALQYMNDTGLVFFTKYYLRIQRVMLRMWQENPARAVGLIGLTGLMGVPTIMDSGPRISNPLQSGALNYPDAVGQILPIDLGMSLL